MKKILIYSVLCLIAALPVSAQKFYKDAINITNASLWQQGESLYINMQMDMRNLKVSNDRTLTLTPVLTGPDNNVVLPEIVINGRRRQKASTCALPKCCRSAACTTFRISMRTENDQGWSGG